MLTACVRLPIFLRLGVLSCKQPAKAVRRECSLPRHTEQKYLLTSSSRAKRYKVISHSLAVPVSVLRRAVHSQARTLYLSFYRISLYTRRRKTYHTWASDQTYNRCGNLSSIQRSILTDIFQHPSKLSRTGQRTPTAILLAGMLLKPWHLYPSAQDGSRRCCLIARRESIALSDHFKHTVSFVVNNNTDDDDDDNVPSKHFLIVCVLPLLIINVCAGEADTMCDVFLS